MRLISSLLCLAALIGCNDATYTELLTWPNRTNMVHLFEWKFNDIANECETFLSKYGYGSVQVSPVQEHIIRYEKDDVSWNVRYQPVSYKIQSRSGNEADFKDMIERCNKVGVRTVVDVVLNHMVGIDQADGVNNVKSSGDSTFDGRHGTETFPGVPFTREHFNDGVCDGNIGNNDYSTNAWAVRNCRLVGLIDINHGNDHVQTKVLEFLNRLISLGVAGFRVDAAKHMWPDHLRQIYSKVDNLRSDIFGAGKRPFIVNEVIDMGGEASSFRDYLGVGRYTNFNFGLAVTKALWRKMDINQLADLHEGFGYGNGNDADVLNFIDNHDNQREHHRYVANYNDGIKYKMAVAYMLAWDYGIPRVMSSYKFSTQSQGPPHEGKTNDYKIKSAVMDTDETCKDGWVCEHRWPEIKRMVVFRGVTTGSKITAIQKGDQMLAFAREGKGYIALRNADFDYKLNNIQTTLPKGTYCDIAGGDKVNGKCTGTSIEVDASGNASFTIPPNNYVAFHLGSKL